MSKPEKILSHLGFYRALSQAAIQYNSIVFRVVIGFLAGAPLEIIAVIPAIEFFLNFLLEIPGGRLADRFGRIPVAVVGHITVILGLGCGYAGLLLMGDNLSHATVLFYAHGIFIGFTRPFTSGSIEAFYQDALLRASDGEDAVQELVNKSMTLSQKYGRYLTSVAIAMAFGCLFVFHKTIGAEHSFLVGIGLWIFALGQLWVDYLRLGDSSKKGHKLSQVLAAFLSNTRIQLSCFYSLVFYMGMAVILGFLIVSIGRHYGELNQKTSFSLIIAFIVGSQALGWVVRSIFLPRAIQLLSEKRFLEVGFLNMLICAVLGYLTLGSLPVWVAALLYFLSGIAFSISIAAFQSISQNMIMAEVESKDFASALSLQNMPGLLFIAGYSFYLSKFRDGSPSLAEIFYTVAFVSVSGFLLHLLIYREKRVVTNG